MQTIPAEINLENGKEVLISTYENRGWLMSFRAFGDYNYRHPESISAVGYISRFTKPELFLLPVVCGLKDENNKVTLRLRSFSPAEQAKIKKAIQLWIKKKLLVRIKREHYMINPWFLVPPKKEQVKAMDYWRELCPSKR